MNYHWKFLVLVLFLCITIKACTILILYLFRVKRIHMYLTSNLFQNNTFVSNHTLLQ